MKYTVSGYHSSVLTHNNLVAQWLRALAIGLSIKTYKEVKQL